MNVACVYCGSSAGIYRDCDDCADILTFYSKKHKWCYHCQSKKVEDCICQTGIVRGERFTDAELVRKYRLYARRSTKCPFCGEVCEDSDMCESCDIALEHFAEVDGWCCACFAMDLKDCACAKVKKLPCQGDKFYTYLDLERKYSISKALKVAPYVSLRDQKTLEMFLDGSFEPVDPLPWIRMAKKFTQQVEEEVKSQPVPEPQTLAKEEPKVQAKKKRSSRPKKMWAPKKK